MSISRYSKLVSRGEEDISYFRPQRFKINFDQDEISRLEKQIGDFTAEIATCEKHIQKINDSEAKNRQDLSSLKREIAENIEAKFQKNQLEITLKHKKDIVEELSKPFDSSKVEQYKVDKRSKTLDLVKLSSSLQETLQKTSLQYLERDLLRLKQNYLQEKFSFNSSELAKLQVELTEVKKNHAKEKKMLEESKNKLRVSKEEAHECTADESKDVSKKPPPNYAGNTRP